MKRLLLSAFLLLGIVGAASASFSGYQYERTITISSTNVSNTSGTVNNLPVLISTTNVLFSPITSGGRLFNNNGYDLVFSTIGDCSLLLHWDEEGVNLTGSQPLNVWVQVPILTTATATAATLYMCYVNPNIVSYQGNFTLTYDTNTKGVYHLSNGTVINPNDSTANGFNGSLVNTPTPIAGQIDGAVNFVAVSSQEIDIPTFYGITTASITIEGWANVVNVSSGGAFFKQGDASDGVAVGVGPSGNGDFAAGGNFFKALYEGIAWVPTTQLFGTGWHQFAYTVDATGNYVFYEDGAIATGGTGNAGAFGLSSLNISYIGGYGSNVPSNRHFSGGVDEIKISNKPRNFDWIKTEYNNQLSPTTFSTIGAESYSYPGVMFTNGAMITNKGSQMVIQ